MVGATMHEVHNEGLTFITSQSSPCSCLKFLCLTFFGCYFARSYEYFPLFSSTNLWCLQSSINSLTNRKAPLPLSKSWKSARLRGHDKAGTEMTDTDRQASCKHSNCRFFVAIIVARKYHCTVSGRGRGQTHCNTGSR